MFSVKLFPFSNGKTLDGFHLRVDMAARDQVVNYLTILSIILTLSCHNTCIKTYCETFEFLLVSFHKTG